MSSAPVLRSLGAKFDTPHRRKLYRPAVGREGLFAASPTLTSGTHSLSVYEAFVRDQGNTSGCEGPSSAMAAWMAFLASGTPLPWFPSEDGIYKDARCMERSPNLDGTLPALTDSGTMTSDVITIFRTCGLRKSGGPTSDGRNSDLEPATINHEPRLDELEAQAETPVLVDPGGYAVDLTDTQQALAVIQRALSLRFPVRIDIICDNAFQAFFNGWTKLTKPLSTCNPNDPGAGGHAIVLGEMTVTSAMTVTLAGLNSWGENGAPPLVAEGPNLDAGHWQGDAAWFKAAVQQATIWDCMRAE